MEVGLKIWVIELMVDVVDEYKKVVVFENLFIMFFSYFVVEGVILWYFWDGFNWY